MWQELTDILGKISEYYKRLLALGQKKRSVLVMVDMKGLDQLLKAENEILARIQAAEQQRQEILKRLAAADSRIQENTKMTELYMFCPFADITARLKFLYESLNQLVAQVQELNDNNSILISGALSAVNYRLNQIGGSAVEPAYGGQGQEVVSHNKNFDFKA